MLFEPDVKDYYHNRVGIDFNVIKNYDLSKKKARTKRAFLLSKENKLLFKVINYICTGDSVRVIRTFSRISVMPE